MTFILSYTVLNIMNYDKYCFKSTDLALMDANVA